jgi:superfamily II DNA/RNA helicase
VQLLAQNLVNHRFKVAALMNGCSKKERIDALKKTRLRRVNLLLCTDMAARGMGNGVI